MARPDAHDQSPSRLSSRRGRKGGNMEDGRWQTEDGSESVCPSRFSYCEVSGLHYKFRTREWPQEGTKNHNNRIFSRLFVPFCGNQFVLNVRDEWGRHEFHESPRISNSLQFV